MTLQQIEPSSLMPGRRLPASLFTQAGVKLLGENVTLSESMCRTIAGFKASRLFLARSLDELATLGVVTPAQGWQVGAPADGDLLTRGGTLAAQAGATIEPEQADALELGSYSALAARECARARAQRLKLADEVVFERSLDWERLPVRTLPSDEPINLEGGDGAHDAWESTESLELWRSARVGDVRRLYARLLAGVPTAPAAARGIVDELIERLESRPRRFTVLALPTSRPAEFLPDHAYTTAALSVAIAARLGWGRSSVRDAGMAGLLSDLGMGLVPREVRTSARKLTEIEVNHVRRHPTLSVMLLEGLEGLEHQVCRAVLHHQERDNGSGYPRGLRAAQISDLARVVAVADAFSASTAQRPYKLERRPYDALEDLITLGAQRVFGRGFVRALVESTGLFPVGSFVKLSSGEVGQVLVRGRTHIDRPRVLVHHRHAGTVTRGRIVELEAFTPDDLHVVLAADRPEGLAAAA